MKQRQKIVIGSVELVEFPLICEQAVSARIDTGAKTSSISATTNLRAGGELEVTFLADKEHKVVTFDEYSTTVVASSNGMSQRRYVIKMPVRLAGRLIRARFTLADRSSQVYPVLIGRNVLQSKFIVDVSIGNPDEHAEQERTDQLRKQLEGDKK